MVFCGAGQASNRFFRRGAGRPSLMLMTTYRMEPSTIQLQEVTDDDIDNRNDDDDTTNDKDDDK